jgi:hypothetical protein
MYGGVVLNNKFKWVIAFLLVASEAQALSPDDMRPKPYESLNAMTDEQRSSLIAILAGAGRKYLSVLKATSSSNFKHLTAPPGIIMFKAEIA